MPIVVLAREDGSLTIALIFEEMNCSCSHLCKSQEGEKRATTRDRPYHGRIGLTGDLENLAEKDGEIPLD
jgi:hypothetical protein